MNDIVLEHVSKSFDGQPVLRDISLTFPAGSVNCLMGPSGRGKTTLLRLILGLERPDDGTIRGVPERCSAAFQEPRLVSDLSVLRNVLAVLPRGSEERAEKLLKRLGLGEALGKKASELSGGMAARTSLARALLAPGELLVLDEPFRGLDEAAETEAASAVRDHSAGRTVIMVTHSEEEAALIGAERILNI